MMEIAIHQRRLGQDWEKHLCQLRDLRSCHRGASVACHSDLLGFRHITHHGKTPDLWEWKQWMTLFKNRTPATFAFRISLTCSRNKT